jgi:pimeloyl-ACP methyl ester carboxylesterase
VAQRRQGGSLGKRLTSNPLLLVAEGRALLEAATLVPSAAALLATAPKGDGHHVVVIPPFGAGDSFTTVLRTFLRRLGYHVHKWHRPEVLGLHRLATVAIPRITELRRSSEGRISIIGHSLGGIYAREIARSAPDDIRDVISVGSPFSGDMKSNYVWPMYEVATGTRIDSIPTRFLEQMSEPPAVPATAIFSKSDGVAHWSCCVERDAPTTENIEVIGSHIGLLHNPAVFYVIANRLAQPEGEWQPFRPSGLIARLARPAR